jgi:hypothetical protein
VMDGMASGASGVSRASSTLLHDASAIIDI